MPSHRRRRARIILTRQTRLAISIAALIVLILAVVLIVRGCSAPNDPAMPASGQVASPSPAVSPDPDASPGPSDPSSEEPDQGEGEAEPPGGDEGEPDASENVPEEEVDLHADLMRRSEPALPAGARSAVIRSIGDIVAHAPILKSVYVKADKSYDFAPIFESAKPSMMNADYTVLNVDGPLGGKKFASYRGYPQFNTPPHILYALKACGVDMLTLANNHALDTYFDGLKATIDNVEKVGIEHIGAYRTQAEYDTPKLVTIGGIRVGFTNYTVATNGMAKKSDPLASKYGLRMTSNSNAPKDIKALRDAGAEVVLVFMHWGEEYERTVSSQLKKQAQMLIGAGADAVIGGHQHVVLPCEMVSAKDEAGQTRTGLVLYGMGNFLSDQRARYRDSGIIFEFTIQDNPATGKVEVVNPRFVPTYVQRTKSADGFDYKVLVCGDVIDNPPAGMDSAVLNRIKQVWNEQKTVMENGPAAIAKN